MDLDRIRKLDADLGFYRNAVGTAREEMKPLLEGAQKDGIEPLGYRMAVRLRNFTPTKRAAILATFSSVMEALGIDAQRELFEVVQGGKTDDEPKAAKAKPTGLKPPARGKVRGKGALNRQPAA